MNKKLLLILINVAVTLHAVNICTAAQLRVAVPDMPVYKGNPFTGLNSPTIYTWSALFDSLTRVNEFGKIEPSLALKWQNIEPRVWRFSLRPNIVFHNNEVFDADAVIAAIQWLKSTRGETTTTGKDISRLIEKTYAIDSLTVDFITYHPDATFPANMSEVFFPAPRAWKKLGPEKFSLKPHGTGPFKLISWTENGAYLEAAKTSWRSTPKIKKLFIFEVPERFGRLQALLAGQADIAIGLSYDHITAVKAAGHHIVTKPAPLVSAIQMVSVKPDTPFSDLRVRIAANIAIDRKTIAKTLLGNLAQPANQPAAPHVFGYNPNLKEYPYDPERARHLLKEAGYPTGFDGRMEVVTEATIAAALETQIQVAADLSRVGIRLDVIPIPFSTWLRKWYGTPNSKAVDFPDLFSLNIVLAPQLDVGRIFRTHSCEKQINGYSGFYCDPSIMGAINKSRREFDPLKRQKILHAIMKNYHENPSAIYLFSLMDVTGVAKNVSNVINVNRHYAYENVTIK